MTIKEINLLRKNLTEIELPNRWISVAEELLKDQNLRLSVTALEQKLKISRYTIHQIFDYLQMYLKENL